MTYISRKERIIVSRWLDECDAEYKLRATRKRSDGRLKRHISCDDLRAWVNDDWLKNEHFLELMSDGEAAGKNRVRLFGRYIPVPVLIKLVQNLDNENFGGDPAAEEISLRAVQSYHGLDSQHKTDGEPDSTYNTAGKSPISHNIRKRAESIVSEGSEPKTVTENEAKENFRPTNLDNFSMERKFFECSNLLSKAIGKLEKIENIATLAMEEAENAENKEAENARNQEARMSYFRSKSDFSSYNDNHQMQIELQSKTNLRRARDSAKYMELLRKISCLRQKLKKVQDCRLKINEQIRVQREAKCYSMHQVTELYSRREQAKIKTLQRKLEKLISTKGKLLTELTDAVSCLNKLKRSASRSRSTLFSKPNYSKISCDQEDTFHLAEPVPCACGCQCSENNLGSSESEKYEFSDSVSSELHSHENILPQQDDKYLNPAEEVEEIEITKVNPMPSQNYNPSTNDEDTYYSYKEPTNINAVQKPEQKKPEQKKSEPKHSKPIKRSADYEPSFTETKQPLKPTLRLEQRSSANALKPNKNVASATKTPKKSRIKFVCPESPCKKSEDLENYQLSPKNMPMKYQQDNSKTFQSDQIERSSTFPLERSRRSDGTKRPSTSPLEKTLRSEETGKPPARRFRSETTMKEIEKALRNYDQRLNGLDSLENKIEKLRKKLSDSIRKRHELLAERDDGKKQKASEREQSNREIAKLYTENRELKIQVQKLAAKSDVQLKKIQALKAHKNKVKELESETEDLKKELSEYQDSFKDQRKCIGILESVVAVQRTEIKKLINLIKKLTSMNRIAACCQDKRNIQRSRSYSPESNKTRRAYCRAKPNRFNGSSDEECEVVCCEDYYQYAMRQNQEKYSDRKFYPQESSRRLEWCVN